MKLICSLKNRDMLETVSKYVEGVVLGCKYSFYSDKKYSKEEINEIYQIALQKNIKTYILLNLVMHENYVDEVKEFIESFKNEEVYFIFQDLGILNILLSLNKARYGIYNPLTMITNYRDLKEYEFFSLDAIGVSSEIPVKDVNKCTSISNKVFYLGFGYHPMYQTYRKLLSLYKEHSGLKFTNENLYLQEATRVDVRCPIIENEFGSVVFIGFDDNGEAAHASYRSTGYNHAKGDYRGSDKRFAFRLENEHADTVRVFESAIDLLSYICLCRKWGKAWCHESLISTAGVTASRNGYVKLPLALEHYLEKYPYTETILVHFDNDKAGQRCAMQIKEKLNGPYKVKIIKPKKGKDYNEYLQIEKGMLEEE